MKRIIGMVLTVSIIVNTCIVFGFSTFADNGVASEPSDFLYDYDYEVNADYEVVKKGIYIKKYIGGYLKVSIPDMIEGYPVTEIGSSAFSRCAAVTYIEIPDSITKINLNAFSGCSSLEEIIIPESVTCIDMSAFSGCNSLKKVIIPESVTYIGSHAFSNCNSLKEITIPISVKEINNGVFSDCSSLEKVNIPKSVTKIASEAFSSCRSLKEIFIPSGVTDISSMTFFDCSSLERVVISDGITAIDSSAFWGCTSLKKIIIPDSVKYISGGREFYSDDMILENIKYFDGNKNCSWSHSRFTRAETADDGGVVFRCVNCGAELRYYAVDTGEQPDISDTTGKTVDSVIIPDTTLVTEVSRETKPFDKPQITEPVTSIITDDISETEPVTAPIESLGDINGDGKVNSKDLTRLMKIIAGVSGESAENVDINGDGKVNSKDLTRLMKMIAGDTAA